MNHKTFFDQFKQHFDASLDQAQVDGIEFLITSFENDNRWADIRHIAYALATIYHETAGSMQPVEEGYYLGKRAKAFQKTLRYYPFFGRGYVQLTWKTNYERAGKALGIDLVNKPELALSKEVSYQVLTRGMFGAWFTKHRLTDHINDVKCDYVNARRIINGTDKAGLIAGYAKTFERILVSATSPKPASASEPLPTSEVSTDTSDSLPTETTVVSSSGETVTATTTTATQDITLSAPEKDGATAASTKMTIGGIVVPGFIVTGLSMVKQWVSDGYLDAKEVGSTILSFIQENQKYVFLLIALLIVLLIIKKLVKQITFWIEMLTHAIPSWNSVKVEKK